MRKPIRLKPLDYKVIETFAFKYPQVERGIKNSYYSQRLFESKFWWKRYELMLNLWKFKDDGFCHVIDVGGGYGFLLPLLAKLSQNVCYIDLDLNHVRFAKELVKHLDLQNVDIIAGGAQCLPLRDEGFHTMFAADVLEHIPDLKSSISELKRVLKENGQVIICSPTENLFYLLFRLIRRKSLKEETHSHTSEEVLKIVSRSFSPITKKWFPYLFRLFVIALCEKKTSI